MVVVRTYTVTDACLNATTASQTINVDDTTPPLITGTIATTTVEGCVAGDATAAVTTVAGLELLGLAISDACTSDPSLVVTHVDVPTGTCPIVVVRTYTVTDACLNATTASQTINVDDTTPPLITGTIATTTVEGCVAGDATAAVTTVAGLRSEERRVSDACTSDPSLVVTHVDVPTGTCPIVVVRTYTVTDACLNATTASLTINVDDTTPPLITGTIATTTVEGCVAGDATAAVTTVAGLELLGLAIKIGRASCRSLVETHVDVPTGTCPIVVVRKYTVTDECLNATTASQTINVDDTTPPLITGTIATTTVEGCVAGDATAAVTTVAGLELLGLAISDACTSDPSLVVTHVDVATGTCPIVVVRTYTVTDACLNATTASQTINVDDTTPPLLFGTIATTTVEGCVAGDATAAVTTVAGLEL